MIIKIARPLRRRPSRSFRTPARTDTSSIETGSSATSRLRLEHERCGDRDSLTLPSGELVRIAVEEELGRRELGPRERIQHSLGARLALESPSPWISSGSSTAAWTRNRGSSDSYGSW